MPRRLARNLGEPSIRGRIVDADDDERRRDHGVIVAAILRLGFAAWLDDEGVALGQGDRVMDEDGLIAERVVERGDQLRPRARGGAESELVERVVGLGGELLIDFRLAVVDAPEGTPTPAAP